jgi:ankyrin repeat protein
MTRPHELSEDLVEEFVQAAHFSLAKVQSLHQRYPALLNARWEKYNELAIEAAGHTGQRAIAEYLLTHGAPLQIFVAATLGNTQAVARFLHEDPSLANARGVHGISLCYHAALSGNLEILELIDHAGGHEGRDEAIHAATRFGHTPVVAWLLGHGATNLTLRNFEQKTPVQVALDNGYADIVTLLRQHGATG